MNIITSLIVQQGLVSRYVLLDNDFYSRIFNDENLFNEVVLLCQESYLAVDELVKIEFLRNTFLPKQLKLKEEFITDELFYPLTLHQQQFKEIMKNILVLSQIYQHQLPKNNNCRPSFVDLYLAARLMYQHDQLVLITGNKKDFPTLLFDVVGYINYEEIDGHIRVFSIITFSREKYDFCYAKLQSLN